MAERVAGVGDPEEKLRIAAESVEAEAKRPLPEVERFPVLYYAEGIASFALALKLRQIVATRHWLGDTAFSLHDLLQEMAKET